jgi:Icc protein
VFAVEDTSVQFVWSALTTRELTVEVGDRHVTCEVGPPAWLHHRTGRARRLDPRPGGPGAIVVDGLQPATTYPVWVHGPKMARTAAGEVTTLRPPPGRLLARFATISDTHIGERHFAPFDVIVEGQSGPSELDPYPVRCARAALLEAREWGSTLMVVKGDLTAKSRPSEFSTIRRLLVDSGMDCVAQYGNHDVYGLLDPAVELAGIDAPGPGGVAVRDLPGLRVVLGHSPIVHGRYGVLDEIAVARLAEAVGAAAGPAMVSLHHAPQQWPVPIIYPPGLTRTSSRRLIAALRAANPTTLVVAGHSHRNRRYTVDGAPVVEVGSTKDYPGVWAGYAIHEGGIRQVVRRISRPDVMAWTEGTARALSGQWGRWSPGRLQERCWSLTWPPRAPAG